MALNIALCAGFSQELFLCPKPEGGFEWKATAGRWYHHTGDRSFSVAKEYCSAISGSQLITLDNPHDVAVAYEYHGNKSEKYRHTRRLSFIIT